MDTGHSPDQGAGAALQGGVLPKTVSGLSEMSGDKQSSGGSSGISKGNDLPAAIHGYTELGHTDNAPKETPHRLSGDMVFAAPAGPAGVPVFGPATLKDIQVVSVKASNQASDDDDGEPENTWMDPAQGEHGGLYVKFLRKIVFPFMVRYSAWIVFAWLIIFAISCAFGLKFLDNTRSNLDLPRKMHGTPVRIHGGTREAVDGSMQCALCLLQYGSTS
jgi:hypothetical protein